MSRKPVTVALCVIIPFFLTLFPLVVMAADTLTVAINGRPLTTDVPPILQNDRTLVPLRPIFEAFDANVAWDDSSQTVTAIQGTNIIILQIGNPQATVNGQIFNLDVPPIVINNRTLVPLRFVAESLQAHVNYDDPSQAVSIIARIRHDIDIFSPYPPDPNSFNHGVFSGSHDSAGYPSGPGLWTDHEGNHYNGSFGVHGNDYDINDAKIYYEGYTGNVYVSPYSGPPGPPIIPGPPDPGGWGFEGHFWGDIPSGTEKFEGKDTFGDGSSFLGKYWYDVDGKLHEVGKYTFFNGFTEDVNTEGNSDNTDSNNNTNATDKRVELNGNPRYQQVFCPVNLTATPDGIDNPEFKFVFRGGQFGEAETGDWTLMRDWGASNTHTWSPGWPGTFAVKVFARTIGAPESEAVSDWIYIEVTMVHIYPGKISGQVMDSGTSKAVPNALIDAYNLAPPDLPETGHYQTFSDDWGRFAFTGLPLGDYNLVVNKDGYALFSERINVNLSDTAEIKLLLVPVEIP